MGIWYTTREAVKAALDIKQTARSNAQVDDAIESASRAVEGLLHREFYPLTATRFFPWPANNYSRAWRLWLDECELVSISALSSGDVAIAAEYFLEPVNSGPPYDRVELNIGTDATFETGDTYQRNIEITGVWAGAAIVERPAGTAVGAVNSSVTGVGVSDSAAIGVGAVLKVDSERMVVTAKSMLDTGQNLQADIAASNSAVTVAVSSGSSFAVDEVILLDAERMRIVDIAGNNLIVKRAWDGSTLAAHSGSDIYAARSLTVERGALGTTAASHSNGAAVARWIPPGPVEALTKAYAINTLLQENSGYARTAGEGENAREFTGRGIRALEKDARRAFGRKGRIGVV